MRNSVLALHATLAVLISSCGAYTGSGTSGSSCSVLSYSMDSPGSELPLKDGTYGGASLAQSIQLNTAPLIPKVRSVSLKLAKYGTLDNLQTLNLSIETSTNAFPSGTAVNGAQAALPLSTIPSAAGYVTFVFPVAVDLNPALSPLPPQVTYWLRLRSSYAQSATNFVKWSANDSPTSKYSNGRAYYETSTPGTFTDTAIGSNRTLTFLLGC